MKKLAACFFLKWSTHKSGYFCHVLGRSASEKPNPVWWSGIGDEQVRKACMSAAVLTTAAVAAHHSEDSKQSQLC